MSEMSGDSPGRRNVSRYSRKASSILVSVKSKDLRWTIKHISVLASLRSFVYTIRYNWGCTVAQVVRCRLLAAETRVNSAWLQLRLVVGVLTYSLPGATHLTKLSSTCRLLLLLIYSPIIFLSKRGFSRRKCTTSCGSTGVDNRWLSCRNWIPFFGFELKCSEPVARSWNAHRTHHVTIVWFNLPAFFDMIKATCMIVKNQPIR